MVVFVDLDCRFDIMRMSEVLNHRILEADGELQPLLLAYVISLWWSKPLYNQLFYLCFFDKYECIKMHRKGNRDIPSRFWRWLSAAQPKKMKSIRLGIWNLCILVLINTNNLLWLCLLYAVSIKHIIMYANKLVLFSLLYTENQSKRLAGNQRILICLYLMKQGKLMELLMKHYINCAWVVFFISVVPAVWSSFKLSR